MQTKVKALIAMCVTVATAMASAGSVVAAAQDAVVTKDGKSTRLYMLQYGDTQTIVRQAGFNLREEDLVMRSTGPQGEVLISVRSGFPVSIQADGKQRQVRGYYGDTVQDALEKAGVRVDADDMVSPAGGTSLQAAAQVRVQRRDRVTVKADGTAKAVTVQAGATVSQALQAAGVSLGKDDMVSPSKDAALKDGAAVQVSRVRFQDEKKQEAVAFKTVEKKDDTLDKGKTRVETEGKAGVQEMLRRSKFVDGKLVESTVLSTKQLTAPTDRVVRVGSKTAAPKAAAARPAAASVKKGGSVKGLSYKKVFTGSCTAYTGGGWTASGLPAAYGRVAVDPREIPYGTRLYIASPDGKFVYGYAVAADTGGFVHNSNTLADLYFDSYQQCANFGRRTMNVYVLA